MIGICGLLPAQEHEKKEGKGRIKANWHADLLCVERRAKIKHFNYRQVHSIRKQAYNVLKSSVPDLMAILSLLTASFLRDELIISRIKSAQ